MSTNQPQLSLEEVRAMAKAAGLRLTEKQLAKLHGEVADLWPRLQRLAAADVSPATEPDWISPHAASATRLPPAPPRKRAPRAARPARR
jgi:Asp-tRNA(Asn)/Glu-tRNA(Gln) amidotransferase C subunit